MAGLRAEGFRRRPGQQSARFRTREVSAPHGPEGFERRGLVGRQVLTALALQR